MNKHNNFIVKALRLVTRSVYPHSNTRKVFAALGLAPMAATFALLYAYFYLDLPETIINGVWIVNYTAYAYAAIITVSKCALIARHSDGLVWLDRLAIFITSFALASFGVIGFIVWMFCN